MIHDDIRDTLRLESMGAVMSCRAARAGVLTWQKRLRRSNDPRQKLIAQKKIASLRLKVHKCKQRGLMI